MVLRESVPQDYKLLADLHIAFFPGFFLSTLGVTFLNTYYKVLLKHPETICLFAEDDNSKIIGYLIGRERAAGYLKRVLKSAPLTFCWEGLKLLFFKPKAIIRIARNLEKKRDDADIVDKQNYAEIGLIGVAPEMKGMGIGHKLFDKFNSVLKDREVKQISLTTDAENNNNTISSYMAWGFDVMYSFTTYPNRKMYRFIKNVE